MPELTPNYGLKKPQYNEAADIQLISDNMDIIDGVLKTLEDQPAPVNSVNNKVGDVNLNAGDILTSDNVSLESFYQNSKNKLGKDLEARNEIIDIKLKLKEQTAINFINKTGIGFFDTFMDNTYIDLVNTTATHNNTNKNVEFGNLTPYDVTAYEATTTNELKIKYPHSARKGDLVKGTDEILNTENIGTTFDVQDTPVINGNYSTQGNGGRKLVRLDDGTLVCAVAEGTSYIRLYKSINGVDWSVFNTITISTSVVSFSIATNGTNVYIIYFSNANVVSQGFKNDGTLIFSNVNLDTSSNTLDGVSLTINETKTELHACWTTRNTQYTSSFNIRYVKGTINVDGTVTWGAYEQVTKHAGQIPEQTQPTIICVNNNPVIISTWYSTETSIYIIICNYKVGSTWNNSNVYNGGLRGQGYSSAIYVPQSINGLTNGRVWVVWSGQDSTDVAAYNIRVSYSDDLGVTWSAMQKLTSGNVSGQLNPTITANKNNEVFIIWYGQISSKYNIRKIKWSGGSWGTVENITNQEVIQYWHPSTLVNFDINFTNPLFVYTKANTSINYYGTGDAISHTKLTLKNPITAALNEKINVVPQPQRLKIKDEIFDPFNSMDLNLYMNKMYKARVKNNVNSSKTIEIDKSDKPLYQGSKLWINNKENLIENVVGQLTQHDRQNTQVLLGNYSTSGVNSNPGGRKLIRLDDGTLVTCGVRNASNDWRIWVAKSVNGGQTWISMGEKINTTIPYYDITLETDGVYIYVLITAGNTSVYFSKLTKDSNFSTLDITQNPVDSNQTGLLACSMIVSADRKELHAAWASKNTTYNGAFNIRYCKGIIASDGTVTWGTVEQVTAFNNTSYPNGYMNLNIILTSTNIPIVICQTDWSLLGSQNASGNKSIIILKRDNSLAYKGSSGASVKENWSGGNVHTDGSNKQEYPSAIYVPPVVSGTPNGRIWVAWDGYDSINTSAVNINVSYSDDLGVTWSRTKLTTGAYHQTYPTISVNKSNEVFIIWGGASPTSAGAYNQRRIKWSNGIWGSIVEMTNQNSKNYFFNSALSAVNLNFTLPPFVYTLAAGLDSSSINFYGIWEDFGGYTLTMKDSVTLQAQEQLNIVDMEVNQDGVALPLMAVDAEKFIYKATTLDTDTAKITVKGYENKVETIVYAIA